MGYQYNIDQTGIKDTAGLSINVDPTKFDIGASIANYFDEINKEFKENVIISEQIGTAATNLDTASGTWIGYNIETSSVVQQTTPFTRKKLSTIIQHGRFSHFKTVDQTVNITGISLSTPLGVSGQYDLSYVYNGGVDSTLSWNGGPTQIINRTGSIDQLTLNDGSGNTVIATIYIPYLPISDQTDLDLNVVTGKLTKEFNYPILWNTNLDWAAGLLQKGTLKLDDDTAGFEANGTDLSVKFLEGKYVRPGAGEFFDNINFPTIPQINGAIGITAFRDTNNNAILGAITDQLPVLYYDDGTGVLKIADDGYCINIYLYMFPDEKSVSGYTLFWILGRSQHTSIQAASDIVGSSSDFFVPYDISGGCMVGCISCLKGITNLTDSVTNGLAIFTQSNADGRIENNYEHRITKRIILRDANDFPPVIGGERKMIAENQYMQSGNINIGDSVLDFSVTSGSVGFVSIAGGILTSISENPIFKGTLGANTFVGLGPSLVVNTPNSNVFDFDGDPSGTVLLERVACVNAEGGGNFDDVTVTALFSKIINCGGPLIFNNCKIIGLNNVQFTGWKNNSVNMIEVYGDCPSVRVESCTYGPNTNERFLYIDSGTTLGSVIVSSNLSETETDRFWGAGSKKEDDPFINVFNNPGVTRSRINIETWIEGNTGVTTVRTGEQNVWKIPTFSGASFVVDGDAQRINLTPSDGTLIYTGLADSLALVIGDALVRPAGTSARTIGVQSCKISGIDQDITFDNTTNTVNITSGAAPEDGEIVSFYYSAGTLPALLFKDDAYKVVNSNYPTTPGSCQVSFDGATPITFADDGSGSNTLAVVLLLGLARSESATDEPASIEIKAQSAIQTGCRNQILVRMETTPLDDIRVLDMYKNVIEA